MDSAKGRGVVYIDGELMVPVAGNVSDMGLYVLPVYALQQLPKVVAIRTFPSQVKDGEEIKSFFYATSTSGQIISDQDFWLCEAFNNISDSNWFAVDFNDAGWSRAVIFTVNNYKHGVNTYDDDIGCVDQSSDKHCLCRWTSAIENMDESL
ncbi:hypothetical protein HELRODRAFT_160662 [Helobdella robusta]|uniref:Uncharacterized protein n=1 Tax=Helobdella robusta TaxID=6412 RepID=T1EQK6_HELRO|nr:hypothetical protein HELRODRAFT_160662 [Helobdella robusta]ESO06488.1 hypothetical protein HELRODRAFT_160662 [Helobdella robusta]